eukprot:gb/GEZN01005253.1/.p1 GENE.gb/GEZN01005253.1/~~gb/GEZN01005253.1/.p1  ORF type:complete len:582 (+),score=43.48 gb/GEZN01005253.1/:46-1791(+)
MLLSKGWHLTKPSIRVPIRLASHAAKDRSLCVVYQSATANMQRILSQGDVQHKLLGGLKGIERECLRVDDEKGLLAKTRHPYQWGSPLTHPTITTDFSESMPEFVTPPYSSTADLINHLHRIHRYAANTLAQQGELMWPASMPCRVDRDGSSIPLAQYGDTNTARLKAVYRKGLSLRYGRHMQIISGIHFNYSPPEEFWPTLQLKDDPRPLSQYKNDRYFGLIRNFQRKSWMIPYLFGSSPCIDRTFAKTGTSYMSSLDPESVHRPLATCLRMSDIGYRNENQSSLFVSYENVSEYVSTIRRALRLEWAQYKQLGLFDSHGERQQLNSKILQIENEFYSYMRAKQIPEKGEWPSAALKRAGVRYVELRALDVQPNEAIGVGETHLRFLEAFCLFCLLSNSPPLTRVDASEVVVNQRNVASYGRDPNLELCRMGEALLLKDWAYAILCGMEPLCKALDQGPKEEGQQVSYTEALEKQFIKIECPSKTPSAKILDKMMTSNLSHQAWGFQLAQQHSKTLTEHPLTPEEVTSFYELAKKSVEAEQELHSDPAQTAPFEEFLAKYMEAPEKITEKDKDMRIDSLY